MATINYCLTLCHAADGKNKAKSQDTLSKPVNIENPKSDNNHFQLFGRTISVGSAPVSSLLMPDTRHIFRSMSFTDSDE